MNASSPETSPGSSPPPSPQHLSSHYAARALASNSGSYFALGGGPTGRQGAATLDGHLTGSAPSSACSTPTPKGAKLSSVLPNRMAKNGHVKKGSGSHTLPPGFRHSLGNTDAKSLLHKKDSSQRPQSLKRSLTRHNPSPPSPRNGPAPPPPPRNGPNGTASPPRSLRRPKKHLSPSSFSSQKRPVAPVSAPSNGHHAAAPDSPLHHPRPRRVIKAGDLGTASQGSRSPSPPGHQ